MVCAPDVKRNDQKGEGEHQKRHLPLSRELCVRIANGNELLDDSGELCRARWYARDPSNAGEISGRVREWLLEGRRSELADPVVLSSAVMNVVSSMEVFSRAVISVQRGEIPIGSH